MSKENFQGDVIIIGAGLVGSLLAVFLAKRGYTVDLLERRPDMRKEVIDRGRSINLAVSVRGLHALELAGLKQQALEIAIPMPGRMVHLKDSTTHFYPYGLDSSEAINSISRGELNKMLLSAAENTGKVDFHFNTRVTKYELETSTLECENLQTKTTFQISRAPVFGTDGSASAIRRALANQPGANLSERKIDYGYKELVIPPGTNGNKFLIEKNALHIWPRSQYMLIALPNLDGSFTATLFLPFQGPVSFAQLTTTSAVEDFFQNEFPDAVKLLPGLCEDFFSNPTGEMFTVKCLPWRHTGKCLLLGDAAHAIVPFFGQGMNAGFEDLTVLDSILETVGANWESAFNQLEQRRKINTDAIADLAEENFIEMRDRVADEYFQAERQIEKVIEREFPDLYVSRYRLVSFSQVPYSVALEAGKIENRLLTEFRQKFGKYDQIDIKYARSRIETELSPVLAEYIKKDNRKI
ncbi:FAD-dependent monooxygenase [bacterium]|nr:FAD-dependent monooxygenase [bacterium]